MKKDVPNNWRRGSYMTRQKPKFRIHDNKIGKPTFAKRFGYRVSLFNHHIQFHTRKAALFPNQINRPVDIGPYKNRFPALHNMGKKLKNFRLLDYDRLVMDRF